MEYVIKDRQPADALRYFEEISQIPRGSGNEEAAARYLEAFAAEQGLWCHRDKLNNVLIKKGGSPGCENFPAVLLQGHIDIVCAKREDVDHDFEKDPISLEVKDNMLWARGTTLGADNGTAIAYMMALLAGENLVHPPLECLFTVSEEVGLEGMQGVDFSLISAKRMLNLDCGPESHLVAGAAGGQRVNFTLAGEYQPVQGQCVKLKIRGLAGGHSGGKIGEYGGNAHKLMARLLHKLGKSHSYHLISIEGGSKDNAIPQDCTAIIALPCSRDEAEKHLLPEAAFIKEELSFTDPDFAFSLEDAQGIKMLTADKTRRLVDFLYLLPNGVTTASIELNGTVTASSNLAVISTGEDHVLITCSLRSMLDSLRRDMYDKMEVLAGLLNLEIRGEADYPSWRYEPVSPLRELCTKKYRELTGKDTITRVIHGGLECGVVKDHVPDMDIVAIGPNSYGAHTPEEHLDLDSFAVVYTLILDLLKAMAAGE